MLISFTEKGLYCQQGNFYIDPWKPVDSAVITHAHSDHARSGHQHYLCHYQSQGLLRIRLGEKDYQSIGWNEPVFRNGVRVTLHPAGHIIGSAQVRVEYKGEVWVVSGDYKTSNDGISGAFEPLRCNTFITESTFGLPIYHWKPQEMIYTEMRNWVIQNQAEGYSSVFQAYSLGKAQRIIDALREFEGKIFVHHTILQIQQSLISDGWNFPRTDRISDQIPVGIRKGCIFISPVPIEKTNEAALIGPYRTAASSGWMQASGRRRWTHADMGFVLSDHADWNGLLSAVKETGAEKVFVTHGFQSVFSRYLNEIGIAAAEVKTHFGEEEGETAIQKNITTDLTIDQEG